jgi:hypothetical protein
MGKRFMPALDEIDSGAHPTLGVRESAERLEALESLSLSRLLDEHDDEANEHGWD